MASIFLQVYFTKFRSVITSHPSVSSYGNGCFVILIFHPVDGDHMQAAAQALLHQIEVLSSPPTNGRSFMVLDIYGRGTTTPPGEGFKKTIFDGLHHFHTRTNGTQLDVSYVDFSTIWNGVLGPRPGYSAFGFTNPGSCLDDQCSDPDHYFYWFSG